MGASADLKGFSGASAGADLTDAVKVRAPNAPARALRWEGSLRRSQGSFPPAGCWGNGPALARPAPPIPPLRVHRGPLTPAPGGGPFRHAPPPPGGHRRR